MQLQFSGSCPFSDRPETCKRWTTGKIKIMCLCSYYILLYGDLIETNRKWWIWGPRGKTKNQFEKTKQQIQGSQWVLPALVPSSSVRQRWGEISGGWCRKNISYPRICFRLQKKQYIEESPLRWINPCENTKITFHKSKYRHSQGLHYRPPGTAGGPTVQDFWHIVEVPTSCWSHSRELGHS